MKQPSKQFLKDQLALAADEIIRLRESREWDREEITMRREVQACLMDAIVIPFKPRPWWRRWLP